MRTNLMKSLSALGVFALGLAGAFATEAGRGNHAAGTPIDAFQKGNPLGTVCNKIKSCQVEFDEKLCRVDHDDPSSIQLWGMQGSTCTRTLYRYVP
ncbi:hypothetical protein [Flavobacterium sp. C4GT6]|uniref:hypothetical protein n=1 Tax=Flavobacterium sp. C4GT6 TaxID=3103818 RepID=UPI002ED52F71